MTKDGEPISIVDSFVSDPVNPSPCNAPEGFDQCFGIADLTNSAARNQWTLTGGQWTTAGVELTPGGTISGLYALNPATNPELKTRMRTLTGDVLARYQISNNVRRQSIVQSNWQNLNIEGAQHQSDGNGPQYTVSVSNISLTGGGTLVVSYICVQGTTTNTGEQLPPPESTPPPDTPGAPGTEPPIGNICTFTNNSFTEGTGGWNVASTDSGTGEIYVQSGGSFEQTINVPAGNYTISAVVGLWHYNTYTPAQTSSDEIELDYKIGSASFASVGSVTWGELAQKQNVAVIRSDVTLSATNDVFTFRATLTDVPSGVRGTIVRSVCLSPEGATGPGSGGGGGGGGGIFPESCEVIAPPTSDGIGAWISWQWAHLNNFFQCDLMVILNAIYGLIARFFEMIGWAIRYMMALVNYNAAYWSYQVAPWLEGWFTNIAVGNVTTINTESGQCSDLFCLLDNLFGGFTDLSQGLIDLLSQALDQVLAPIVGALIGGFNLIIGIIGGVFEMLFRAVDLILTAFNNLIALFAGIIDGWNNATPATIDGLPSCNTNPQGNGLCIALWVMENTVFSGRGALLIPLLLSYAAVIWLLWAIRELKKAVMDAALRL